MSEWLKLEDLIATRRQELTSSAEQSRAVTGPRGTDAFQTKRGIVPLAVIHRLAALLRASAFAASTATLQKH